MVLPSREPIFVPLALTVAAHLMSRHPRPRRLPPREPMPGWVRVPSKFWDHRVRGERRHCHPSDACRMWRYSYDVGTWRFVTFPLRSKALSGLGRGSIASRLPILWNVTFLNGFKCLSKPCHPSLTWFLPFTISKIGIRPVSFLRSVKINYYSW